MVESLPVEILVKIFLHLPRVDRFHLGLTCKALMQIFYSPLLWKSFTFIFCSPDSRRTKPTSEKMIKKILSGGHLRFASIKYDTGSHETQKVCNLLTRLASLKNLCSLNLSAPYPAEKNMVELFSSAISRVFNKASRLDACIVSNTQITDKALACLANVARSKLRLLEIRRCKEISNAGVLQVATRCIHLQELALDYSNFSTEILLALAKDTHASVKRLDIDVIHGAKFSHEIEPIGWRELERQSSHLRLTYKFFCLTDEEFEVFFKCRTPVTSLVISQAFSKTLLQRIAKHCPLLEEFVLCGMCSGESDSIVEKALIDTAENCNNLNSITLSGFSLSCHTIEEIARACGRRLVDFGIEDNFIEENADLLAQDNRLETMCVRVSEYLGRSWSSVACPMFF